MTFQEFKTNVEQWAEARGIYEHSTPLAQALKAVSEVGELADAVIKGDREALKDAIGDVAVCLVNVARMIEDDERVGSFHHINYKSLEIGVACVLNSVSLITTSIAMKSYSDQDSLMFSALNNLSSLALCAEITFEECCAAAWNEIKDRKGRMVPGGAFVKEGEA